MAAPGVTPQLTEAPPEGATFAGHVVARPLPSTDPRVTVVEARAPDGALATLEILSASASADAGLRRAFERLEARRGDIRPPLLPVSAAGVEGGRRYVARARPEGTALAARLEDGPIDPREAVRLLSEVAGALGSARALGLPVGGLTPDDVLLTGSPASALLVRYGLAAAGGRACERPVTLATAPYLAPEAARGAPVEPASTVYALACVLVACLTGAPPFVYDQPLLTVHAHLTAPPPAVASRVRGLPREIDEVLSAALAKTPERRPRSPERLMRAVQGALATSVPIPVATSAPVPVAGPRARAARTGAAPVPPTPADARPERRRPATHDRPKHAPRGTAARARARGRATSTRARGGRRCTASWRAALAAAASLVIVGAGFAAGTLATNVRAAAPRAAPDPPAAARRAAATHRLDDAMTRLSATRAEARARLRRARDARGQARVATTLADAYRRARRVASAGAAEGAPGVAAHLAGAEHAYRRLARAAAHRDRRAFAAAARQVVRADRALAAATARGRA